MFGRKKKRNVTPFDRNRQQPTIRASICTGEQVAGFVDLETGRFLEVCLLRTDKDLQDYMEQYGVEKDEIKRIW